MTNRIKVIEDNLHVTLPLDYREFIEKIGLISDERGEFFGYIENIDIEKIPCVIGATKLYKQDYYNIADSDIVINFDDFENNPIVLDTKNGAIYNVTFEQKTQINSNFKDWLNQRISNS